MNEQIENQIDYTFIQRIIQELTQSCALPLPIPAASIPSLVLQAAQFFWENDDMAVQERYWAVKNNDIQKCGSNKLIKLPQQIIGIAGCYKITDSFNYGAMGDFSLERMILNNSAMASGVGGSMTDVYGSGTGYGLTDITAALYEVSTYKFMFDTPLTYNFNSYSSDLVLLGELGYSDLMLRCWMRCKIQELYNSYYFFRFCIALGKRSLATIIGTFDYKMPGGVNINYNRFFDQAEEEIKEIKEWLEKRHSPCYFINSNTI